MGRTRPAESPATAAAAHQWTPARRLRMPNSNNGLHILPRWFLRLLCAPARPRQPAASKQARCTRSPSDLVNSCLLLPFLCLLLVPTIKLDQEATAALSESGAADETAASFARILAALLRLPLDKLRLQSGLALSAAAAAAAASPATGPQYSKSDLQEEEQTHVMLLAPAEQRSSYSTEQQQQAQQQQQPPVAYVEAAHADVDGHYGEQSAGGQPDQQQATLVAAEGSSSASALQARSDLPAVRALNVKCEKNHMTVNIVFDRPFYGMVFSKGHYNDQKCVHLGPNSGQTSANFDIHLGKCGMSSSDASPGALQQAASQAPQQSQQPNGVFIENTIIIQYDPLVQEIYDQARKLRCTWYDYYEKSVTFRPYNVDMLDAVTANFLGDNIQCWMQIQVGKGPWSSEVAGIVKIGQTMTMVLAIKDDENRFDMLVRNCVAHDGKHAPIQLVDEYGCVARPKIMSRFQKVRNFGPAATVVSYAHFQAFKFPDSMSVHFQCVIQVCRYECPEPVCSASASVAASAAPELQAPNAAQGPTSGGADYAASGTEMVAAKEPLPAGYHHHHLAPSSAPNYYAAGQVNQSAPASSVQQLRLDESQGRVQVRLDTSMLAGSRAAMAPGALPPHLLHSAPVVEQQPPAPPMASRAYLTSSPYHRQQSATAAPQSRRPGAQAPPGGGAVQAAHAFSLPYPHHQQMAAAARRSTSGQFASRLGELALDEPKGAHSLAGGAPYEQLHPLSLIAAPRGLRSGLPLASELHRLRRSLNGSQAATHTIATAGALHRRHANQASGSSTSVQTQRSIQVVSPDDVAFSLMDGEDFEALQRASSAAKWRRAGNAAEPTPGSVCFSAARFLWGALVTLGALASSIVAVTYVILRQRAQLGCKLSAVYEPTVGAGVHDGAPSLSEAPMQKQHHHRPAATTDEQLYRRQQAELQQRNTYLARLYSQFAPASYWR